MRLPAFLTFPLLTVALLAQAPAPSLGDKVKAERPAVEKLLASFDYPEAKTRAEALLPAARPTFNKTDNTTLIQSCSTFLDSAEAYRLATEAADSAGAWEKALDYAKAAQGLAAECYAGLKDPFANMVAYYKQAGVRAKQVLEENDARIKELKANTNLDPGERQELDLALSVEKEVVDSAKWVTFFQTYLDVSKRESVAYDPLVKVMQEKLKGEADQVAEYNWPRITTQQYAWVIAATMAARAASVGSAGQAQA